MADPTTAPQPCGGCGAISDRERCIGCLHDFSTQSRPFPPPEGVTQEQWDSVLAQRPAAVRPDAWHRMMLTSHRLAARESRLAQILYEQIEMAADHEGGMAPTWEEVQQQAAAPIPRGKRQREDRAWCSMHLMEFRAKARELLGIHDADALEEINALLSSRAAEIRAAQQQGGADDAG